MTSFVSWFEFLTGNPITDTSTPSGYVSWFEFQTGHSTPGVYAGAVSWFEFQTGYQQQVVEVTWPEVNTDTGQGRSVPVPFTPVRDVSVHVRKLLRVYGRTKGVRGAATKFVAPITQPVPTIDVQVTSKVYGAVLSSKEVYVSTSATAVFNTAGAYAGTATSVVAQNVSVQAERHRVLYGHRRAVGSAASQACANTHGLRVGSRQASVFTVLNPSDEELIAAYIASRRSKINVDTGVRCCV